MPPACFKVGPGPIYLFMLFKVGHICRASRLGAQHSRDPGPVGQTTVPECTQHSTGRSAASHCSGVRFTLAAAV